MSLDVARIRAERGLKVHQRLIEPGPVCACTIEEHATEDSLRVVEVRVGGDELSQIALATIRSAGIDEHHRPLEQQHGVCRFFLDHLLDARERFVEAAFIGRQLGQDEIIGSG